MRSGKFGFYCGNLFFEIKNSVNIETHPELFPRNTIPSGEQVLFIERLAGDKIHLENMTTRFDVYSYTEVVSQLIIKIWYVL
jgi:hypothetical protein